MANTAKLNVTELWYRNPLIPVAPPDGIRGACFEPRARAVRAQHSFTDYNSVYNAKNNWKGGYMFANLEIDTIWVTDHHPTKGRYPAFWKGYFPRVAFPALAFHKLIGWWCDTVDWDSRLRNFAYNLYYQGITNLSLVLGNRSSQRDIMEFIDADTSTRKSTLRRISRAEINGIIEMVLFALDEDTANISSKWSWSTISRALMQVVNTHFGSVAARSSMTEEGPESKLNNENLRAKPKLCAHKDPLPPHSNHKHNKLRPVTSIAIHLSLPTTMSSSKCQDMASSSLILKIPARIVSFAEHDDAEDEIVSPKARAIQNANSTTEAPANEAEDVTSDTLQLLLRLANKAGTAPVTISGSMLTNLLGKINTAKSQLQALQAEAALAVREMEKVQVASGMIFPRFKKLPMELRVMIWRIALSFPRIIGVETVERWEDYDEAFVPVANHSPLRSACQESRLVASVYQRTTLFEDQNQPQSPPPIFYNALIDTVLLHLPDNPKLDQTLEALALWLDRIEGNINIPRVAISAQRWADLSGDTCPIHMYALFGIMRVKKVYLVLGDFSVCTGTDMIFIEPRGQPKKMLPWEVTEWMEEQHSIEPTSRKAIPSRWSAVNRWENEQLENWRGGPPSTDSEEQLEDFWLEGGISGDWDGVEWYDECPPGAWFTGEFTYVEFMTHAEFEASPGRRQDRGYLQEDDETATGDLSLEKGARIKGLELSDDPIRRGNGWLVLSWQNSRSKRCVLRARARDRGELRMTDPQQNFATPKRFGEIAAMSTSYIPSSVEKPDPVAMSDPVAEPNPVALLEPRVFTCFPQLPTEMRQKIFMMAAMDTSIVAAEVFEVELKRRVSGIDHPSEDNILIPIRSSPPLLQVSHEARNEALRVFEEHHQPKKGEPKLYINKYINTLWCTNFSIPAFQNSIESFVPESFGDKGLKIRQLATGWEMWPRLLNGNDSTFLRVMKNIQSLGVEEILIVMKPSHRFNMPWLYSNIEFRNAQEIDASNEMTHWKMVRERLPVSKVTVRNIETAIKEYAQRTRNAGLRRIQQLIAAGVHVNGTDEDRRAAFDRHGGQEPWTMPKIRLVEAVNLNEDKFVPIEKPKNPETGISLPTLTILDRMAFR
ncbi:hypothetical protein VTL71DRAFT_8892 [Oculimacula yallundae]|uniref:2EXR domain-containing protein n=1 Tax=Oculimacula yallundae TaxID=86028 RepID=A0ABR4BTB8_9HELO